MTKDEAAESMRSALEIVRDDPGVPSRVRTVAIMALADYLGTRMVSGRITVEPTSEPHPPHKMGQDGKCVVCRAVMTTHGLHL